MPRRYSLQDEATLVSQLNHLLHALALPISLISPTDLTPRLLIAILESLLGARLPIPMPMPMTAPMLTPTTTRDRELSQGQSDASNARRTARVQSMKIFLGVLETDILQRDAGLSNIDPRRLADGEDAEVFYVAEVLCSIGIGIGADSELETQSLRDAELARARSVPLPRTPSPSPPRVARARPTLLSPKSQLDLDAASLFQSGTTTTMTTRQSQSQLHPSLFSPFLSPGDTSNTTTTSLFSAHHEDEYGRASDDSSSDTGVSDILGGLPPLPPLPATPPPHLHRRQNLNINDTNPDDSLLFSATAAAAVDNDNRPIPRERAFGAYHDDDSHDGPVRPPRSRSRSASVRRYSVRYAGHIAPADEAREIAAFELSRSSSTSSALSTTLSTSRDGYTNFASIAPEGAPSRRPRGGSVKAQYTRTLELLTERARLLTQLAELRTGKKAETADGHRNGDGYGHEIGHG